MPGQVSHLWRHPIKGHGVESIPAVTLTAGMTLPWDRVWAIAHEAARITPENKAWASCANFSRGAKSPELMAIRAQVNEAAGTVTLSHPRLDPLTVDPDRPEDAARLVAWVQPISETSRARPAFVAKANGLGLTDSDFPSVSILSHASLAALETELGQSLAMERFRGNIWLTGFAPWAEFDWIGHEIRIGTTRLLVRERITRCKATTVNPDTGQIDADTLGALQSGWQHRDFGIYAEVISGGTVSIGDAAELL